MAKAKTIKIEQEPKIETPKIKGSDIAKGNAVLIDKFGVVVRIYTPAQSDDGSQPNPKTYIEKAQGFAKKKGLTVRMG